MGKQQFLIEWQEITYSYADRFYEGVQYIEVTRGEPECIRVHACPTEASQRRLIRLMQTQSRVRYGERRWDSAGDDILDRWWEFNPDWTSQEAKR